MAANFSPGFLENLLSRAAGPVSGSPGASGAARGILGDVRGFMATTPDARALQEQTQLAKRQQDLAEEQFRQSDARRQQMLNLLGLTPQTVGEGGLLGGTFFQSILGNTLPDVVGGITGALPGGTPGLSQPGFADSPSAPGTPGSPANGGSLFDQLLGARGQLGEDILGDIAQFGDSARARINEDFQNLGNTALARLEDRGFAGSSLLPATMLGVEEGRQEAVGALEDQLLSQRIGAKQQIGEGLFGDVGAELDRGVQRQQIGASLLNALLGSALSTVRL